MPVVIPQAPSFCECGNHAFLAMRKGVTLVDPEDAYLLKGYGMHVNAGYAHSVKMGKLHRVIMGSAEIVDHKNRDKLDNRRFNLRSCTVQQNQFNKRANLRGKSRFKGVSWLSSANRWVVRISLSRRKIWVGSFKNEEEAARDYDVAATHYYGEFAFLNFPDEGDASCHLR